MQILIPVAIVAVLVIIFEFSQWIVYGPIWRLGLREDYLRRQLSEADLNSCEDSILSTENGYFSSVPFPIFAHFYYCDMFRGGRTTVIPRWHKLHKEIRDKRKSLLAAV